MTETLVQEPSIVVISGTHSAGKSTLLEDVERGKLEDLGIHDSEYTDFGYGWTTDETGDRHPIVTVPEAARWWADVFQHPDFLAENYRLSFQLGVDSQVIFRAHAAARLGATFAPVILGASDSSTTQPTVAPIVLCDRGPLDGVVYSQLRIPNENTNIIEGSPRTGFMSEWLKSFVNHVVIADHAEVSFEVDAARLADAQFRDDVAKLMVGNYKAFLGDEAVTIITGDRESRQAKLVSLLGKLASISKTKDRTPLPYGQWSAIELDLSLN